MYTFTFRFISTAILLSTVFAENCQDSQSPVNIIKRRAKILKLPSLHTYGYSDFEEADVKIINTGQTVEVKLAKNSHHEPYILYGGPLLKSKYVFDNFHFHWGVNDFGSEHEIDRHQYAMEVHLVHFKKNYGSFENAKNYKDGLCVVTFFGEIKKKDNQELAKFINDLWHIKKLNLNISRSFKKEFSWLKRTIDLLHLRKKYFVYNGSLTTSPFTECVIWIIYTDKISLSRKQLSKFRKLHSINGGYINENIRPIQPLNNRTIIYAV